jgi:hypothetical protein
MWFRLSGVNYIRKLHSILDKEDGDIISNNVPVAFFRVELDREASHIANGIGRATATQHSREAHKDWRLA